MEVINTDSLRLRTSTLVETSLSLEGPFTLHINDDVTEYSFFYYIDTSILLEHIPLVKFINTTSGTRVVYFQTHVSLSMT